jgi:hypothetical protein
MITNDIKIFSKGILSFNVKYSHDDFVYWQLYTPPGPRIKRDKFVRFQGFRTFPMDWRTSTDQKEFCRRYDW